MNQSDKEGSRQQCLISHLLPKRDCERLRTDSAHDPCHYLGMKKKRTLIETERTTIASVKREMQKPRLAESVRNGLRNHAEPLFEEPSARPEKV
jgi:hypothetical protein